MCERSGESSSYKYWHYSTLSKNTAGYTILKEMLIDDDGGAAQNRGGRRCAQETERCFAQITINAGTPHRNSQRRIKASGARFICQLKSKIKHLIFTAVALTIHLWLRIQFTRRCYSCVAVAAVLITWIMTNIHNTRETFSSNSPHHVRSLAFFFLLINMRPTEGAPVTRVCVCVCVSVCARITAVCKTIDDFITNALHISTAVLLS